MSDIVSNIGAGVMVVPPQIVATYRYLALHIRKESFPGEELIKPIL